MEYKKSGNHYIVRLDKGEEINRSIQSLILKEGIKCGSVTGIGATNKVSIGVFDTENKRYTMKTFEGEFEIAALMGNITTKDGEPYTHLHITVGDVLYDRYYSGHMSEAFISCTSEIIINAIECTVEREFSEEVGLNLLKLD